MERIYHCVYRFSYYFEDFRIKGVFTRKEDAEEFMTALNTEQPQLPKAVVGTLMFEELKAHIVKEWHLDIQRSFKDSKY